jgi:UDP-glucose 4-epimerase
LRDYIQVTDLARAHLDALRYLRGGGKSLVANCGYAHGFSVLEVIDAVKRVSGVDFAVEFGPRRPGDPASIVASNARARAALGWTPEHDNLEEIVRQALDWEKRLMARGL